jgi:D-3-phosphoglycerate dehydrogenase / 2-oxoglutarate reductase
LARIYSTHQLHPQAMRRLAALGDLTVATSLDEATLIEEGAKASIIVVRAPIPAALMDRASPLRAAIRHGAGLDMIPVEAASRAGVLVANVPGVNANAVAEYVLMCALMLMRRMRAIDSGLRTGGWNEGRTHADSASELAGRRLGIVGYGNVGRRIHAMAAGGFAMETVVHSRRRESIPEHASYCDLDTLMARCDIIVLCCPLTPETRGMIDARRIGLMRPDALLINVARGPIVDEDALVEALRNKAIGGAALDVFSRQPLPANHALLAFDNVVLTPHLAGITRESMLAMGMGVADEAGRILSGKLPVNLCNTEAVDLYRTRFI